jgi:hypothetical protein
MRFFASCLLVLGLLLSAGAHAAVPVPAGFPPTGTITYDVWRDGSQIGTHTVEFTRDGDELKVHTRIRIAVKLLLVTIYRFEHDADEDWVDGKLMRFAAKTDDNGTDRDVLLVRQGDELRGHYNDQQTQIPGNLIPASLWNPATVDQTMMIEPTKGRAKAVTVIDRGVEQVKLPWGTVPAHHYSVTGDIRREVWYGEDGQVVQAAYRAKDGSLLTFKLRGSPAAAPDSAPDPKAAAKP